MRYEVVAVVGDSGCGTILNEVVNGNESNLREKLKEIRNDYGTVWSLCIYEDGIKTFDSAWRACWR